LAQSAYRLYSQKRSGDRAADRKLSPDIDREAGQERSGDRSAARSHYPVLAMLRALPRMDAAKRSHVRRRSHRGRRRSARAARALSLSILPLLRCRTREEMLVYLARQGSIPPEWASLDQTFSESEAEPESDSTEDVIREIVSTLNINPFASDSSAADRLGTVEPAVPVSEAPTEPFILPSIDAVQVAAAVPANAMIEHPTAVSGSTVGWSTSWVPRSLVDQERDRMVRQRGEELVYRLELDRLQAAGHRDPEKHVVWTSRSNPGADHDIMSLATDGEPLWIEVKSTMGTDGRFEWPRAEFEKALREGGHYELWRVYEAHTDSPTVKAFRNPASLLRTSALRLELGALRAFVEPKDPG
jgi:hypothetical protein